MRDRRPGSPNDDVHRRMAWGVSIALIGILWAYLLVQTWQGDISPVAYVFTIPLVLFLIAGFAIRRLYR